MHYCQLSDDCYKCNVPFCPYEKYGQDWTDDSYSGWDDGEDEDVEE